MYIMVDVETAGFQNPAQKGSHMTEFGAIAVSLERLEANFSLRAFHGIRTKELFIKRYPKFPDANNRLIDNGNVLIDVSMGINEFSFGIDVFTDFEEWIKEHGGDRPIFISDNNGFDYSWISHYFWKYLDRNPFGHSSTNLGSLYKGIVKNVRENFKHLRKPIPHDHNPVNDALGNVKTFIYMVEQMNLKGV